MRVQDTFQDMVPRTRQADAFKLGAQDVDRATVQRFERVSARDGALFHERFLGREERCVKFALGRCERTVYGEGTCCCDQLCDEAINNMSGGKFELLNLNCSHMSEA